MSTAQRWTKRARRSLAELRSLGRMYARFYDGEMNLVRRCLAGSLLRSLMVIPISLLAKQAIDHGFGRGRARELVLITAAMTALYLLNTALSVVIQQLSSRANTRATATLRKELSQRIYRLPRSFITQQEPAEIQSIIVGDTARVADFSGSMINGLVPSIITVLALTGYLVVLSPPLGLAMLITAPLSILVNAKLRSKVEAGAYDYRLKYWRFNGTIHRAVRVWDLTSAQNAVAEEVDLAVARIDDVAEASRHQEMMSNLYSQAQNLTVSLAGVVVMLVGGLQVQRGSMTMGTFLSFFVVMSLAQNSTRTLLSSLPGVLVGREALLALLEWLDAEHRPPYEGTTSTELSGGVSFEGVSFAYGDFAVLDEVDVDITAGSMVAIVGPNGAGKTTMMNLLLGWYRPTSGRLVADGLTFDELSMQTWRDSVGLVHQDPAFLNASVRDNIVYGRPETTDEEIWAAARFAAADDVIAKLASGLDTQIGEGGVLLSGGQRQRLALTRALVRRPRLLVLDEPTNHLDRKAVKRLLAELTALPDRPTVIVITHDAEVLDVVDRVFTLESGTLHERLPVISAAS